MTIVRQAVNVKVDRSLSIKVLTRSPERAKDEVTEP